jgi:hypothetical protein
MASTKRSWRRATVVGLAAAVAWALTTGAPQAAQGQAASPDVQQLAKEVATRGWIVFAARTPRGDYDLYQARPDGSQARNVTNTPDSDEYGGRFSPDGKRILYRRSRRGGAINHDVWGAMGALVIADADGANPVVQGREGEFPWASWSPDGQQVACLYKREGRIRIIELATKRVVKELPRQGIFQQMYWSPDGKRLVGTANVSGQDWNIVALELETGKVTLLTRQLNCTADWFQNDPNRVIYSHRTPGLANDYGWTMLMEAAADGQSPARSSGQSRALIYGERGRHIYYGCTSPDDRYAIFSFPVTDGGTDANMAIIRLADAPIIVPDDYKELKALYPNAKSGPVFRLPYPGFEPHWTYAQIGGK